MLSLTFYPLELLRQTASFELPPFPFRLSLSMTRSFRKSRDFSNAIWQIEIKLQNLFHFVNQNLKLPLSAIYFAHSSRFVMLNFRRVGLRTGTSSADHSIASLLAESSSGRSAPGLLLHSNPLKGTDFCSPVRCRIRVLINSQSYQLHCLILNVRCSHFK